MQSSEIRFRQVFKIWAYSPSLSRLLLRARDGERNLDVLFSDVKKIECRCTLEGIEIHKPQDGLYTINGSEKIHAATCHLYENRLDRFECDLDVIGAHSRCLQKL